jgi:ATP-dependent exoDNAse (exonuclease V) alpha subunit
MKCGESVDSLLDAIYPGIRVLDPKENNDQYFLERTILNARNDDVDELNERVLGRLHGPELIFHGADSVITERGVDGDVQYPVEYLNTINVSGLPLAQLKLKIGAPIMILRNLDPSQGLCNGTRAILTQANERVLEVRILGGDHAGKMAFIPRITICTSNNDLPFELRRRQFPVRLAFAMTINKSQGQSVKHIGLDLRRSVFTHGQLYVALSRCTSSLRIKVLLESEFFCTPNIVFPEVLL